MNICVHHPFLAYYLIFYCCFQVDTSNERISLGLKESYFPETEKHLKPVSDDVGMEITDEQEPNVRSTDDAEEFREDDEDEENLVELQGALSDDGK